MDIGTAKLPAEERRDIPHHLLDLLDVTRAGHRRASSRRWARAVDRRLPRAGWRRCWSAARRSTPARSLDRFEFPGTDPAVRAPARGRARRASVRRRCTSGCASVDPEAAAQILPSNGRRVVRALEVIELTGRPFSASLPGAARPDATVQVGVGIPRPVLDERIEQRVRRMWDAGLVDEVRRLAGAGPARGPDGEPGARLPAGAGLPRRGVHRGGGLREPPSPAPAGSPAGRTRGSARTRGSPGVDWTTRTARDRAGGAPAAAAWTAERRAGGSTGTSLGLGRHMSSPSSYTVTRTMTAWPRTGRARASTRSSRLPPVDPLVALGGRSTRTWQRAYGGPASGAGLGLRLVRQPQGRGRADGDHRRRRTRGSTVALHFVKPFKSRAPRRSRSTPDGGTAPTVTWTMTGSAHR